MYQIEGSRQVLEGRHPLTRGQRPRVPRTVLLLGITSFLTDISSEMVSTVLPLYLVLVMGLPPLQFGVIDGLQQGAAVLVRVAAGFVADRRRDAKGVAVVGYALSALTRPLLLVAQGVLAFGGLIVVDRVGKGIRTAPRDAMISRAVAADATATAFGVHRALDTAGAMLGPLIAFALLAFAPWRFDAVFVVSACFAVLGVAVIWLLVREPSAGPDDRARPRLTVRGAVTVLRPGPYRRLVVVGSLLALATVSDAFLFLVLQERASLPMGAFPLLFVGSALVFMVLAVPMGRVADRLGRARVFLAGYAVLGIAYLVLLVPSEDLWVVALVMALLGTFYAMTDGVLQALATPMMPSDLRATGLGLLASATGLARLASSVLFGLGWTVLGTSGTIAAFLVVLCVGVAVAIAGLLRPTRGGGLSVG